MPYSLLYFTNGMENVPEVQSEDRPGSSVKESQVKGRRMWESRMKRKELESQLKIIENRIKHMNQEQQKIIKVTKLIEKKTNDINSIREKEEKFKQEKIEWKVNKEQEITFRRSSLNHSRSKMKENIKEAKNNIINKNRVSSLCIKAQKKANETFMKRVKEKEQKFRKIQASSILQNSLSKKHYRSLSSKLSIEKKESEYSQKLRKEIEMQEQLIKKIEEMTKIEQTCKLNLLKTESNIEDTRLYHSVCGLFADKSISQDMDTNIPSVV